MRTLSPLGVSGPHHLTTVCAYGISDVGPVRGNNEDNFLVDADLELLAVADGMGGHDAGAHASALTLDTLRRFLHDHTPRSMAVSVDPDATCADSTLQSVAMLYGALDFVNDRLYAENAIRQMSEGSGMGTTLTGFWRPQADGPLILFHVGDSRLYRYRPDELLLLTRDQTWYQQALEAGKFDQLPPRNLLLQAIGPSSQIDPDIHSHIILPGDVLMLCSDGLHGSVPHQEMADLLADATADTLDSTCQDLITLAGHYGGRDNVTVLLAFCTA